MIISRTPFRISFFGGGTDYPSWYGKNGGAVLSTTIDKYCYITARYYPSFHPTKHRIVWSKIELVDSGDDIAHPSVRETLKHLQIKEGVEIHNAADLPARSGLGSSSTFTVGLLHALHALMDKPVTKMKLALDAMHIEQDLIKENVGSQDQLAASFGGLNKFTFGGASDIGVQPIVLPDRRLEALQNDLMLVFTGFSRTASEIAEEQIKNSHRKERELRTMHSMVDKAIDILRSDGDLNDFGKLLHETWILKRGLSGKISNPQIDDIYEAARNAGAIGGKLLGAGGGGFMLLFVTPEKQARVREALKNYTFVPVKFETEGSQIIYRQNGSA
ncbi:MAG: kinase [Candidatus Liptonbacteria bacterium RIFCSPLOWO2_01_FULL_56_20]|uniref:Kinase n=1 Tax=Candidatus Liptonbacteria bacterium RIFCSPLOWO2_01_FULL_56_20 TaxID=1798652 RepID=A0A1G2CHG5_9BACT|nr:MAG: GHMP kinase [Parcubacteria group bacterium GW2011_GWB1_56_8]OGY98249.1 MAG: kinase [Candidatus Liptonbacteria bacterium RIFCSPHIGHO2_01_FULL_56_18b]OGZ00854.1 MAG: kinase [Candidatus Liptonbacteria bacterium RIFCSPLOWO2_01_FULL_56_20]